MRLGDGWCWVESQWGKVRCMIRYSEAVEPGTVWTWNAIGKADGAWQLAPGADEARKGFLLNHLIGETLPGRDGEIALNADPITGQAAWYDLRVRIEKASAAEAGHSAPRFTASGHPPSITPPPEILRYGARFGGDAQQDAAE